MSETRLAEEDEPLVLHRFSSGTLGFAAVNELGREAARNTMTGRILGVLRACWPFPQKPAAAAVCLPPGAYLLLTDVPRCLQELLHIGTTEVVSFTQQSIRESTYRDALIFRGGIPILLQDLPEGLSALVLSLEGHSLDKQAWAEEPVVAHASGS